MSKSTIAQIDQYNELAQVLKVHNDRLVSGNLSEEQFNATKEKAKQTQIELDAVMKSGNETLFQHFKSLNGGTTTFGTYIKSLVTSRVKTIALTAATTALNAVMSWGLSLAISALTTIITEWWQSVARADEVLQETIETGNSASKTMQDLSNDFQSTKNSVNEIRDRFIALSRGVDAFGNNVSLTDEQYEEYLKLNNQLAELFPEIDMGLDSQGNHILALSKNVDTLTASLDSLIKTEQKQASIELNENFGNAFEGALAQEESYGVDIEKLKDKISQITELKTATKASYTNDYMMGAFGLSNAELSEILIDFFDMDWSDRTYNGDFWTVSTWSEFLKALEMSNEEVEAIIEEMSESSDITKDIFDNSLRGLSVTEGMSFLKPRLDGIVSAWEQEIKDTEAAMKTNWNEFTNNIVAWMRTDSPIYAAFSTEAQNLINNIISGLDYSKLGIDTTEDVKNYILNNILRPLNGSKPEIDAAFSKMTSLDEQFGKGLIGEEQYANAYKSLFSWVEIGSDIETHLITAFKNMGYEGKSLSEVMWKMSQSIIGGKNAVEELETTIDVSNLSTLAEALKEAASAYEEFGNRGYIPFSNIEELKEKFNDVEGIDEYIKKLTSASLTASELNDILGALVVTQIKSKFSTQELANADANLIANMLRSNGVANASLVTQQLISDAQTELAVNEKINIALRENDEELAKNKLKLLLEEANLVKYDTEAFQILALKIQAANTTSYNSTESINNLLAMAKAAGIAGDAIENLEKLKLLIDKQAEYQKMLGDGVTGKLKEHAEAGLISTKNSIEQLQSEIENSILGFNFDVDANSFNIDLDFSNYTDTISDAYQQEREILDYNHEMGFISTKEYYNKLAALNNKYYKNSAEHQSEYLDNIVELHNMWNTMYEEDKEQLDYQHDMGVLSDEEYYAKLLSLSSAYYKGREGYEKEWQEAQVELRQLQQQILDDTLSDYDDFLSRHEDLMIYSAKAEKDITKKKLQAIEDAYKKGTLSQKEYLEKWNEVMTEDFENTQDSFERAFDYMSAYIDEKLDALDEQNDKLEEQKELEEALAELEKAKMQRNKRMYVDGVGFVWVADQEAIKTAQESYNELLDNKRLEEQKQYWEDLKQSLEDILTFQEVNEDRDITESLFGKNWQTNLENGVNFISNIASKYANALGATQADILIKNGDQASIIDQMKLNSSSWKDAGASERAYLSAQNEALGKALGWVKKNGTWYDKNGNRMYASGGIADFTGTAMLHGSKSSSEVIFNASDAAKLYEYVHTTPDLVQVLYDRILSNTKATDAVGEGRSIVVELGGIHVHGNADRDTITEMSDVFDRKMNDLVSSLRNESIQRSYKR